MLKLAFKTIEVQKLYPLAISRGSQASSENLFVFVSDGQHTGIGELSPAISSQWTAERGQAQLESFANQMEFEGPGSSMPSATTPTRAPRGALPPRASGGGYSGHPFPGSQSSHDLPRKEVAVQGSQGLSIHGIYRQMREHNIDPPAMAALDMALWDLLGKRAGMPLYELWGLGRPIVPTSVTIGINPVEVIKERVPDILARTGAKCLKIKLGCPDGIERDKENFLAAKQAAWEGLAEPALSKADGSSPRERSEVTSIAPTRTSSKPKLRVDANGGWTVDQANHMIDWLAENGADYVEQPLPEGQEADLSRLNRKLPIFVDESCRFSQDVPKFAHAVNGVNLKLMKCGGPTEAFRIVATARAFGLKTMIGCMSETSVAIAAGAHMGALFDHIDLDSHLNLNPDPASGAPIDENGVIMPTDRPGLGAELTPVYAQ